MNQLMFLWWNELRSSLHNEKGQGMVEYGLIMALVAVACIGGLGLLKDGILGSFDKVVKALAGTV